MSSEKVFITGSNGQLGQELQKYFTNNQSVDIDSFDICDETAYKQINWQDYSVIINAAAYTNVDGAETAEGRISAWQANAAALQNMAKVAIKNDILLVHVSSDYVFDGTKAPHTENEPFSPLSVYGQTKAAGDLLASTAIKHYIFRTSWVVGKGKNFIKTMFELAQKGVEPNVVNDQLGRLTFAQDLAQGIYHTVSTKQEYGTYNLTNDGKVVSWANIAKLVYQEAGSDPQKVTGVPTKQYYEGKENIAPRPLQSELNLNKIKATGFKPRPWEVAFNEYIKTLKEGAK